MMKKILSLCALLFVVSGCASVIRSDFAGDKNYPDISSAMQHTPPLEQLMPGGSKTVKISTDSPLLDSSASKGRFERITMKGRKGESFKVSLLSICDCFGFRKWTPVPFAYLLDASGGVVAQATGVTSLINVLYGKFPADGDYALMIVADSTSNGETVGYLVDGFSLPLISHPTGIVKVTWETNAAPTTSRP